MGGIFHCGVEIHSTEFSFVFAPHMHKTGVRMYPPKKFGRYKFCESIHVGWTDLSLQETKGLVKRLSFDWLSDTYHVGRRNCLHFVEALIDSLGLQQQFPMWLKRANEIAMNSPTVASLVDTFWSFASWYSAINLSALDCRSSKCWNCGDMKNNTTFARVYQESLSHGQDLKCCSANSEQVAPVPSRSMHGTIENEEVVFVASNHVNFADFHDRFTA